MFLVIFFEHSLAYSFYCFVSFIYLFVTDPTPERDKSPDTGRDSLSPVPDMDWKRLRLSLNSPVPAPLHYSTAPVRVGSKNLKAAA